MSTSAMMTGLATINAGLEKNKASIDPSQSETLNRMLEGQSLSGAIMVHTRFPLTAGDEGIQADVVGWKGRSYQVRAVNDWAEGGRRLRLGRVHADAAVA